MNLPQLFQMQKALDERIVLENNIAHDRLENLTMALLDEVGECAKETRCFKDWSKKGPSPRGVILEEYVDGFHFVLSLGLYMEYDRYIDELTAYYQRHTAFYRYSTLTRQFIAIYGAVIDFAMNDRSYKELFTLYLCLGDMLGFNHEEIEKAYLAKNKVNHQRQDDGY
ncbi:dUTP diphosphatase [Bacillus thuringiensis]|uniref:dUTP diphosphatase n=1 Tax=Bacillus thuringiensis TaxID=1428 RepID=UPI003F6C8019